MARLRAVPPQRSMFEDSATVGTSRCVLIDVALHSLFTLLYNVAVAML